MASTPDQIIRKISPYYGKKNKITGKYVNNPKEYNLVYNSTTETLEPVYFWILEFMGGSGRVHKLIDNFASTPGSGHFSEHMQKGTIMQEQAMKLFGTVNTVIKSVLNLIYDLKEFQMALKPYDDAKKGSPEEKKAAMYTLKQKWLDTVDIKRGVGSINQLGQQLSYVTLRDAFFSINSLENVKDVDLADRVKDILRSRLNEFLDWRGQSERELRKRYEIEKTYLKSQVDTVKLYSKWAKPYLLAAHKLKMRDPSMTDSDLVSVFNTTSLQLTILGESPLDIEDMAFNKELPEDFIKMSKKGKFKRKYSGCTLVDLGFRGIPNKYQQGGHYAFGGKATISFKAYALNDQEIKLLKKKMNDETFKDALSLVEGMTEKSLEQLDEDIEEFIGEEDKEVEEEPEKEDINPFTALIGLGAKKEKKKEKKEEDPEEVEKKKLEQLDKKGIEADNYIEKIFRKKAESSAKGACYGLYDVYKKSHGMASTPDEV